MCIVLLILGSIGICSATVYCVFLGSKRNKDHEEEKDQDDDGNSGEVTDDDEDEENINGNEDETDEAQGVEHVE